MASSESDRAPDMQDAVAAAFAGVFPAAEVTPDSDFFDLGGDSVAALQLTLHLEDVLGWPVHPSLLIHHPVVSALAEALEAEKTALSSSKNT